MPFVYIMDKDNPTAHASIDKYTNVLTGIDYEHHEIHGGSHYHVQGVVDIAGADDVLDFTWLMPDTTKWIHWTWEIDTEAEVAWSVYENVVANNALANTITPYNSNRNSTNTSATVLKYEVQVDLVAANVDTDVTAPAILLSSGISGAGKKISGSAERGHETVMKQNTLYCLRAAVAAAGYINFSMNWYEHQDKT